MDNIRDDSIEEIDADLSMDPIEIEERRAEEEARMRRRKARIERMKREKRKAEIIQKRIIPAIALVILILIIILVIKLIAGGRNSNNSHKNDKNSNVTTNLQIDESTQNDSNLAENESNNSSLEAGKDTETENQGGDITDGNNSGTNNEGTNNKVNTKREILNASRTDRTADLGEAVISEYGLIVDLETSNILAARDEKVRISPASMTKILTVLTAADALGITGEDWENNQNLKDTFTMTIEITDFSFSNDCSNVGFSVGEQVPVMDLFYGTILPSGADAAVGLACYVAGSQEAFVELMNKELESLGLSGSTHFTNCVGLYSEDHYSTVYDMAVIMKAAADNPFCKQVLSTHVYTTAATTEHPEGITISNWFLRRIEDKDTHGEVLCAKTGFVVQSKNCAASLAKDQNNKEYICVTAGSTSSWRCIYDHVELYQKWLVTQ